MVYYVNPIKVFSLSNKNVRFDSFFVSHIDGLNKNYTLYLIIGRIRNKSKRSEFMKNKKRKLFVTIVIVLVGFVVYENMLFKKGFKRK